MLSKSFVVTSLLLVLFVASMARSIDAQLPLSVSNGLIQIDVGALTTFGGGNQYPCITNVYVGGSYRSLSTTNNNNLIDNDTMQ